MTDCTLSVRRSGDLLAEAAPVCRSGLSSKMDGYSLQFVCSLFVVCSEAGVTSCVHPQTALCLLQARVRSVTSREGMSNTETDENNDVVDDVIDDETQWVMI